MPLTRFGISLDRVLLERFDRLLFFTKPNHGFIDLLIHWVMAALKKDGKGARAEIIQ